MNATDPEGSPDPLPAPAPPYPLSERAPLAARSGGLALGLVMVVAGLAGTWLSWRYFVDTALGQLLDNTAYRGSSIGRSTLWEAAEPVLDLIDIPFVVVVLAAAATIAVLRRRWLLAVQVAVLVGGANITTQLLKHGVFDRPTLTDAVGSAGNSLPSGHTTVAASVAAALVLVVPRRARALVAVLAAGYAALTGVSTMIGGWHRPSDVIAAFAVVVAWAGLTTIITAVGSPERVTSPAAGRASTAVTATFMLLAAGIAGVLAAGAYERTRDALAETVWIDSRTDLATAYVGGALGVVAVSAASFALFLVAHQLASRPGDGAELRAEPAAVR
ncbi:MAG TPA: phosphatase PAP2 family protein [Jiangellaceae bacterium]